MDRLRFGPAGFPNSYSGPREGVFRFLREMGLDTMELEFVRRIWLKPETAETFGALARKEDVVLTAHAPYYINLNSRKTEKIEASIKRIIRSAYVLDRAGGFSVAFHAAFYHEEDPEKVTRIIRERFRKIEALLEEMGIEVWVRPELMGRISQWGDLDELLEGAEGFEHIEPAIDFAHLRARYRGRFNSKEEWRKVLERYEEVLGADSLKRMHVHVSGIVWGEKGERYHVNLSETDFKYKDLMEVLKEFGVRGVVISESPNLEEDALRMKEAYQQVKGSRGSSEVSP